MAFLRLAAAEEECAALQRRVAWLDADLAGKESRLHDALVSCKLMGCVLSMMESAGWQPCTRSPPPQHVRPVALCHLLQEVLEGVLGERSALLRRTRSLQDQLAAALSERRSAPGSPEREADGLGLRQELQLAQVGCRRCAALVYFLECFCRVLV